MSTPTPSNSNLPGKTTPPIAANPNFYATLPVLTQFIDLANPERYTDAPDDWYVLVSDIAGSTQAIADGNYKDVNLLGACSIIAVLNVTRSLDIPFVFGGDGASLLVPPEYVQSAQTALLGVRHLARTSFNLELRVGAVPVNIVKAQYPLKVARFQLTPYYCQASFIGGGITYAADLLKANTRYQFADPDDRPIEPVDLTGLECRWQEIPSQQGQTLSLIVAAMPSCGKTNEAVYTTVLQALKGIYGNAENYRPIAPSALHLTFNPRKLFAEVKARTNAANPFKRLQYLCTLLFENLLGLLLMTFGLEALGVNWGQYKNDVCLASDYQKIDDVLRMVISSTPTRTEQLRQYLDQRCLSGDLVYGIHVTDRALMTCMILGQRDRHFHLIDGADGGYALAAKEMKLQLRRKAQNWQTYTKFAKHRS